MELTSLLVYRLVYIEFVEQAGALESIKNTFESSFITLPQMKYSDIILGSVYRPPGKSIYDFIVDYESTLQYLSNTKNFFYSLRLCYSLNL